MKTPAVLSNRWSVLAAAVMALGCGIQQSHASLVTYASFNIMQGGPDLEYLNNGPISTFSTLDPISHNTGVSVPVTFTYSVPNSYGPASTPIAAHMTFTSAVSAAALAAGSHDFEAFKNISFSFTADNPVSGLINLLTVLNTTTGRLLGRDHGDTISLTGDTGTGATVDFTSDFISFTNSTQRTFSLDTICDSPALSIAGNSYLHSFTADGAGFFASNSGPGSTGGAVPESASLSLLAIGGLIMMQRRKTR